MNTDVFAPILHGDEPWMSGAECRRVDLARITSARMHDGPTELALEVCGRCPVALRCCAHAVRLQRRVGIWSGLTGVTRTHPFTYRPKTKETT